MSLSSLPNRIVYVGDGSSATFSFPYYFFNQTDLKVYLYNTLTANIENQVINTNYTVSGTTSNGLYLGGGSVVMASAIVSTTQIVITRDPTQTQNFILQQNANIPSASLTQQLDYLTLLIQRQQDLNSSSVRLNDGLNASFNPILPTSIPTASNCYLVVNSSGTGWDFALNNNGFGTAGYVLTGNGSTAIATFQSIALTGSGVTGILPISRGGTGTSTVFPVGEVVFTGSAGVYAGSQLLVWDNINSRLGVGTASPDALFTIAFNSTLIAPPSNTLAHMVSTDQTNGRFVFDAYNSTAQGGSAGLMFRRASGTSASPAALAQDQVLGFVGAYGYGTTGFGLNTGGSMSFRAAQIFTNSNQGTYLHVSLCANSTSAAVEAFRVDQDGSISSPKYSGSSIIISGSAGQFIQQAYPLKVNQGGTGSIGTNSSLVQFGVVVMSSLTQMTTIPIVGAAQGQVLTFNSNGAASWQAVSTVSQSGISSIANGGTGTSGSGLANRVAVWGATSLGSVTPSQAGSVLVDFGGAPQWVSPLSLENVLVNSAFDWWQALPTGSNLINNNVGYFADQWYAVNNTGSASIVTVTKTNGQLPGSINGFQMSVTTPATATQSNCLELWQVLDSATTISRMVSASSIFAMFNIKALGQLNQVGVQLFSCSGEAKAMGTPLATPNIIGVQSSICTEQTVSINSNAWTYSGPVNLSNFAYLAGSSGVIAMRIRGTGAQSGFVHSNGAGFAIEQVGLFPANVSNIGASAWKRRYINPDAEFLACQRFYEKSYDANTVPGAIVGNGQWNQNSPSNNCLAWVQYKVRKRIPSPTRTTYSDTTGAAVKAHDNGSGGDTSTSFQNSGEGSCTFVLLCSTGHNMSFQWVSDATI